MAEIKVDPVDNHTMVIPETEISTQKPHRTLRVASLDIFRGLTVALMILVDDAGGEWPMIGHAPWHGCNLADFVMPFFLFIVGMAIPLAVKRIPSKGKAVKKVVFRTLKLLFWGLLLQGLTNLAYIKHIIFSNHYFKLRSSSILIQLCKFCESLHHVGGFSHAPDKLTYGVDMQMIRFCGILQRIAFAYLVVALAEIFLKDAQSNDIAAGYYSVFRLLGACILILYLAMLYGTYVPDWQFAVHDKESADYGRVFTVDCNVRGKLNPPCNAVGYIDREILGINHMYLKPAWRRAKACTENSPYEGPFKNDAPSWCHAPFEPEGILSSISAVLSTIIGVHFGHVLVHLKGHSERLKQWIMMGFALLILGIVLHFTHAIPLNKQLYTFSYVCVTSGAAALVFSAIYILVDIWGLKYMFVPLKWIGMNAMLVYVMAAEGIFAGFINGWYYEDPHNTLVYWIEKHIFIAVWNSRRVGILLYVIFAEILFWAIIAGILHRFGIYWKL
ncbi:heparan-alpha-glucosaminide N-acetyltransferase isoform X1 [Gossypium australe]|uniref:Heparan-alpha-glucosaminide N-acetyltransferase isoform X1 n=1 Tax=Gossypium australe TaxID=47621 RepID=A0A5B6VUD6_9ROSI|nr:heparan-alpha-glucosaminide N-acetyltransferase isoform X1 [Gossypium australe]